MVSLDGIPEGSEQEALLSGSGRARRPATRPITTQPDAPVCDAAGFDMEAFLTGRSHNFRSGLRRARRQSIERTAALGEFHIREFRGHAIDEGMAKLFDLERQSWKAKTTRKREIHVTLNDASRGFHRDVARAFAASDQRRCS